MLVPSWESLKDTGNVRRGNCFVLADHQQLGRVIVIVIVILIIGGSPTAGDWYCYDCFSVGRKVEVVKLCWKN